MAERDELETPVFTRNGKSIGDADLSEIERSQLLLFEARQARPDGQSATAERTNWPV